MSRTDSSRRWVLIVDVKGVPRNVTQKRYLSVNFAGKDFALPYTLTNKSTATFAWSIKGPPGELALSAGDSIGVGIAVQAVPATHVRVMQAALIEQSRKTLLGDGIVLCDPGANPCDEAGVNLDANSSNRLLLKTDSTGTIVGKYVGSVTIGADQKPDGETLNLTIYGTTIWRQLLGVLVILIGVACAWITTTWLQSRLNRAQALLPAAALAERVKALAKRIETVPAGADPGDTKLTRDALTALGESLEVKKLDAKNYIPPSFPLPFRGVDPLNDKYKEFLTEVAARIALLTLIIEDGLAAVWRKIPMALSDDAKKAIRKASVDLDQEGAKNPLPTITDAIAFIHATLDELDAVLREQPNPPLAQTLSRAAIMSPSVEQLSIEIRHLSEIAWLVFGGLAVALGVYVLIINNLGFGVPSDYFVCLFWGFGLPVGGQQLATSTVGSVSSVLGISLPKTS